MSPYIVKRIRIKKNNLRKKVLFFLRFFVGVALLYVVFRIVPYKKLFFLLGRASLFHIFLSFLLSLLLNIIVALRWRFILQVLKIEISFKEVLYVYFSSLFFSLFSLSLIISDLFRGSALVWRFRNGEKIVSSVVVDRISGFLALSIVAVSSFLLGRNFLDRDVFWAVIIVSGVSLAFLFFLYHPFLLRWIKKIISKKMLSRIDNLYKELSFLKKNPAAFLKAVTYSLGIQLLSVFSFFLLAKAFFQDVSLFYFFIFVPLITLVAFLPITVAGIGTRELACIYFFSKIGIGKEVSLAISLFNLFFVILLAIGGGVIYVMVYYRWLESAE